MCSTCDFTLPGGMHFCPTCATKPQTSLSRRRKQALIGSFALAIWTTLGMAALLGGAFSQMVQTKAGEQALGVALTLFVLVPSICGFALGLGAIDRRFANPPVLWAATIWNGIILAGFILLCVVGLTQ